MQRFLKYTQYLKYKMGELELTGELGQLNARQILSTFLSLYTPALQHSLQDLRWCKLFYILAAVSEETNDLKQNIPAQLMYQLIYSVYFSYLLFFIYYILVVLLSQSSIVLRLFLSFIVKLIIESVEEICSYRKNSEELRAFGKGWSIPKCTGN